MISSVSVLQYKGGFLLDSFLWTLCDKFVCPYMAIKSYGRSTDDYFPILIFSFLYPKIATVTNMKKSAVNVCVN